jgi:hypothetical protein
VIELGLSHVYGNGVLHVGGYEEEFEGTDEWVLVEHDFTTPVE